MKGRDKGGEGRGICMPSPGKILRASMFILAHIIAARLSENSLFITNDKYKEKE